MYIHLMSVHSSCPSPGQLRPRSMQEILCLYLLSNIYSCLSFNLFFLLKDLHPNCVILQYSNFYTTHLDALTHLPIKLLGRQPKVRITTSNMTGSWPTQNNKRFYKELRIQSGLITNPLSEIRFWSHQSYSVIWIKVGKCLCISMQ